MKSLLKFSKNFAGQIVAKIKILRARYEVKSPLPNEFLSLLASNSNAFSCARPRTRFEGHTVPFLRLCRLEVHQQAIIEKKMFSRGCAYIMLSKAY